jgi:hypothetical protein
VRSVWDSGPIRAARVSSTLSGMSHPELLPLFATAIAIEVAHLRWIVLTHWTCRGCHAPHRHCDCKYGWLKRFL